MARLAALRAAIGALQPRWDAQALRERRQAHKFGVAARSGYPLDTP
jgi:hypothetical protein